MEPFLMLSLSILQAFLMASLVLIKLTVNWHVIYNYLFITAFMCALILFFLGYSIFMNLAKALNERTKQGGVAVQSHYLLHLVVFIFLVLDQFHGLNYNEMLVFSPFMIAFFLNAVVTWRS